ncbi:sodium-coupled monocarboxylate transporter 1 [Plakobranchus ocellatus]|uniref:Sodium-coupled monocarboxylate transporter 1 n=1 Tax=Plakobranchus ocellatus TaxID=259542 RepID=A0AAV4DCZ7_9GAST|nr:sodium-coupled monocarboxylate transporter 1 [Plakobranchus ocellatus]
MATLDGPVHFGTVDYILLSLMLAGSMAIGIYFSVGKNKQKTKEDYLLGGRRMGAFPVCLSLFATFQSAIALLGFPTEVYSYGTMYTYIIAGIALSTLLAMFTVVPLMYPLQITSVNEYLALRYESRLTQRFGSVLGIITSLSYMTISLLSPALALETAVGIPLWMSIIVVGGVGTVYTTIGGIKSVVWTDVFQTSFMFIGTFMVLIKGCIDAGGVEKVWNISKQTDRIVFDDFNFDPRVRHTVWSLGIGYMIYWYSVFFTQSSFQRTISTRSMKDVNKVYVFSIVLSAVFIAVLIVTGLVLAAYFHSIRCDPLAAGYIKNSNQLVPYFVLLTLRFLPGLPGLYISTVFSGALSTLSSGINALAANTMEDFLSKFLRYKSDATVATITKVLVCFYGCVSIGLAYLTKEFQGPVSEITYTAVGASVGPLLGLFVLSATFPQANYIGALIGCFSGLIFTFWQAIGALKFGHRSQTLPPGPTDNCLAENATSLFNTYNNSYFHEAGWTVAMSIQTTSSAIGSTPDGDVTSFQEREFSIYDFSYIWNPVMGVFVTIIIGLIVSLIANKFMSTKLRPEAKFLFPFCRRFWYSDMDVLDAEMS